VIVWEYLIVALPTFGSASAVQGESASVRVLNDHGAVGWEAVGLTTLADGTVAALLKRSGANDGH
jgi:hypothetical protein